MKSGSDQCTGCPRRLRVALVIVTALSLLGANPLVAVVVGTASVAAGRALF